MLVRAQAVESQLGQSHNRQDQHNGQKHCSGVNTHLAISIQGFPPLQHHKPPPEDSNKDLAETFIGKTLAAQPVLVHPRDHYSEHEDFCVPRLLIRWASALIWQSLPRLGQALGKKGAIIARPLWLMVLFLRSRVSAGLAG